MKKISKKAKKFAEDLKNFFKNETIPQEDKDEIYQEFLHLYNKFKNTRPKWVFERERKSLSP